jgi:thioesterase domain-containing protein
MQETLRYVRLRLIGKLQERFSGISETIKTGVSRMCVMTRRTLPIWVRSHYILRIYYDAVSHYVAQPYSDHIVYIRSQQRLDAQHASQWKSIARSFELYDVPDSDHMSIIMEPYAQVWMLKLKEFLQRVQANLPSSATSHPTGETDGS